MARSKKTINEKYNLPFAVTIRHLMEDGDGITQDELAKAVNKTRQTISQYVNGLSEPGYDTLVKIANFFNVSIDYLLGRTKIKSPNITSQAVIAYTGLSEDNINTLHNMVEHLGNPITNIDGQCLQFDGNKPYLDCLNDLLDAVFYDRETIIKHYIRLRRSTMKLDAMDTWYILGHPEPVRGFEPARYNDISTQALIDNASVEYSCLKITQEIEAYLKEKYIASQEDINQLLED